ncbi:MAG: DUF2219 family protein [Fibrobacteria bacterium]|nr:DUF2219 family protein [Fibrobacteria bacterium]
MKNQFKWRWILPFVIVLTWANAMPPDFMAAAADRPQAGIFISNDARYFTYGLLLDEDRYYSQGIHMFWHSAPKKVPAMGMAESIVSKVLGATALASMVRFGQDIFTPNDLLMTEPLVVEDRAFCGWTHLDVAQRFYVSHYNRPARLHVQVDVGVIGPASFADVIQTWFHEKRRQSSDHPELDPDPSEGWEHQYGSTGFPGRLQFALHYGLGALNWRLDEYTGFDLGVTTHLNAGMLYGNLGAGLLFRAGLLKRSLFVPHLLKRFRGWECFVFGVSKTGFTGWNKVLSGGVSEVEPAPVFWQNEFGLVIALPFPSIEISASLSMWSRETKTMPEEAFQSGHTDYRPKLQERGALFDHGFGRLCMSWLW